MHSSLPRGVCRYTIHPDQHAADASDLAFMAAQPTMHSKAVTSEKTSGGACVPRARTGCLSSARLSGWLQPAPATLAVRPRLLSACASHTLHPALSQELAGS